MRRWTLNAVGLALLIATVLMPQLGVVGWLETTSGSSAIEGASPWLNFSILAGAQLIYWCPALIGAMIIYLVNRRRD
jgi:hypothetical protein